MKRISQEFYEFGMEDPTYDLPEKAGKSSKKDLLYWAKEWLGYKDPDPLGHNWEHDLLIEAFQADFNELTIDELVELYNALQDSATSTDEDHDFLWKEYRNKQFSDWDYEMAEIAKAWLSVVESLIDQASEHELEEDGTFKDIDNLFEEG